jgi:pimeloyl-ACP methyl ester carboxylesterase
MPKMEIPNFGIEELSPEEVPTIMLIHGRFQSARSWNHLREHLTWAGFETIAPQLPTDNPEVTNADCGEWIVDVLDKREVEKVVLASHSGGGDHSAIALNMLSGSGRVAGHIGIAANFSPAILGHPTREEIEAGSLPPKNTSEYGTNFITDERGLQILDTDAAKIMSQCLPEDMRSKALLSFRPHIPRETEPISKDWLKEKQEYIICTQDQITNPDYQLHQAVEWLGVDNPILFDSDHFPHQEKPRELARIVGILALKEVIQLNEELLASLDS